MSRLPPHHCKACPSKVPTSTPPHLAEGSSPLTFSEPASSPHSPAPLSVSVLLALLLAPLNIYPSPSYSPLPLFAKSLLLKNKAKKKPKETRCFQERKDPAKLRLWMVTPQHQPNILPKETTVPGIDQKQNIKCRHQPSRPHSSRPLEYQPHHTARRRST